MKFTERLDKLLSAEAREARSVAYQAERKRRKDASDERRLTTEREIADLYEKLSEADKMLALATRLPAERPERVALAQALRSTSNGRQRTRSEIAGIMGIRSQAVTYLLSEPDRPGRRPRVTTRRQPPAAVESANDRVRRIRRVLGLSQHAFAERLGVSVDTVKAWEAGAQRPALGAYQAVLNLLRDG